MTLPNNAALIVELRLGPATIDPKYTVIIGTSGSTGYLHDTTGNQRLRGDLTEPQEDEYDEARRDEDEEIE